MKKLISLTAALCLLLCLLAGCGSSKTEPYEEDASLTETADAPADASGEPVPTEMPVSIGMSGTGTGFETYPAAMTVATVDGQEVSWMEYYYWLNYYTLYVNQLAAQYGLVLSDWDAHDLSGENTNAEVVLMNAQANLIRDNVLLARCEKLGVSLSEEDKAELQQIFELNADNTTGDGNGEAVEDEVNAFTDYIAEQMHIDRAFFDKFNSISLLSEKAFLASYGVDGADYSDDETLAFAEKNNLLGAKHILLLTVDADTREKLGDDVIAEKRARAEELLAQLQAVKDDPAALEALFDQLMAENTEDNGYASYPDGYVFSEGEMVQEFEDGVKALEIGGLSDIVESSYGFHIILRIPIDPNAVIGTDNTGKDVTLRYAAATQQFNQDLADWSEAAEVVWSDGFEIPDLAAIMG